MPIVVNYTDLGALGSAALESGYQPGLAAGQANYQQRQADDTRMLLQNAFRRQEQDRAAQYSQIAQASQQAYGAQQAEADRNARAQAEARGYQFHGTEEQANRDLREKLNQEDIQARTLENQRQFQNSLQLNKASNQNELERQSQLQENSYQFQEQKIREKTVQEHNNFVDTAVSSGQMQPEEAEAAWAQHLIDKTMMTGPFTKAGTKAGQALPKPSYGTGSGQWFQRGAEAFHAGNQQDVLKAAQTVIDPKERAGAPLDVTSGFEAEHRQTAQWAAGVDSKVLTSILPRLSKGQRMVVEQELQRRGSLNYGTNQVQEPNAGPVGGANLLDPARQARIQELLAEKAALMRQNQLWGNPEDRDRAYQLQP